MLTPLLHGGARIAGLFNERLAEGYAFRRDWRDHFLRIDASSKGRRSIHVHVASAGEFEQALGIVDELRLLLPNLRWTLSFSSPSGYRHVESVECDMSILTPLPLELSAEIDEFLDRIQADAILFIRYDLWPTLCARAELRGIPMILAAATYGHGISNSIFGRLLRSTYQRLSHVSAVSSTDQTLIERHLQVVTVSSDGDPRLSRVRQRSTRGDQTDSDLVAVRDWLGRRRSVVVGSSWGADERLFAATDLPDDVVRIIVPHTPSPARIDELLELFKDGIPLSGIGNVKTDNVITIIVDRLGILTELYGLATVAWVGGGFGEGVHSVAEPAFYGVPILSGPNIKGSHEARALLEIGGLQTIDNLASAASDLARLLGDGDEYDRRAAIVREWREKSLDSGAIIAGRIADQMNNNTESSQK